MPQISKNQKPELIHDKKNNKWLLVFRWKIRGDTWYPVESIDVTNSVCDIFGTFPNYIWELENITFLAIQEMLLAQSKETTDDAVMAEFSRINQEVNKDSSLLGSRKVKVRRTSTNAVEFYSDSGENKKARRIMLE